jgi:uncharacterized delta-60 repeat protein
MPISLNGVSYQTVATTGEPPPETLHLRSMHRSIDRFDAAGQLDPTFGTNGIARLDLSTGAVAGTAFRGDTSWGLTLLPGDDLLVVGGKLGDGAGRTDIDYAVVKLTSHGAVDTTFGTDGHVTLDIEQGGDSPRTAIVQPDGKIVVSGHTR